MDFYSKIYLLLIILYIFVFKLKKFANGRFKSHQSCAR